jgi:hypothetical protein
VLTIHTKLIKIKKEIHNNISTNLMGPVNNILLEEYSSQEKNILHLHHSENESNKEKLNKMFQTKTFIATNTELEQVVSVPVSNYFNVQYFGNIFVGSEFQEMSVILDTGSNILWVSSESCETCRNFTTKFVPEKSTSFSNLNVSKNITYAIGYVNGSLVQDSVFMSKNLLASNKFEYTMGVNQFKFLLVNDEQFLEGTISDGVLGLGIDFEGDTSNSLIQSLYQQGQISHPYFSFYLTDSKRGSRLYIGDIRENTYLAPVFDKMNYCTVKGDSRYWECAVENLSFKPSSSEGNIGNITHVPSISMSKVIFDTGTSFLIIPVTDFVFLLPQFTKKAKDNRCGVTPLMQLICMCDSPKDFDDITLTLNHVLASDQKFTIKMENLIEYYPTLSFPCRFELLVDIFMLDSWILGDSVLRDSLITFDMQNRQVGWVQEIDRISDSFIVSQNQNEEGRKESDLIWYIIAAVFVLGLSFFIIRMATMYARSSANIPREPLVNQQNI